MRRILLILSVFVLTLVSANSIHAESIPWDKLTKVCYNFCDASKPTDEKRDYSIVVDAKNVWLSVRCEGKILIERRYDNTPEKFKHIVKALRSQKIEQTEEGGTRTRGCTSEQITLYAGDKCVFSAYREGEYGNLSIKHGAAHDAFKAAVPENVDNIILETYFYSKKS